MGHLKDMGFVMVAPGDAEACMAGIRNSPSRAICRYMQHCAHIDFTLYDRGDFHALLQQRRAAV